MNADWTEEDIHRKLEEKMQGAFEAVWASHEKYNTTLRMGAYIVALERVAAAMRARGRV